MLISPNTTQNAFIKVVSRDEGATKSGRGRGGRSREFYGCCFFCLARKRPHQNGVACQWSKEAYAYTGGTVPGMAEIPATNKP
jgi:hypothetical protein